MFSNPTEFLILIPPLLFALTVHEWSHGYTAMRLGDPTARLLGRLTLNPLAHLDPLGSLLFLLPPHIGWAKPVPVDVRYLQHPRRDMMWIALAGPVSNIALAVLFGTLLRVLSGVGVSMEGAAAAAAVRMVAYSVILNLSLAVFNMIPIFPLDGSRVLGGLLPAAQAERYHAFDAYGPFLLLGIVLLGSLSGVSVIGVIVTPVVRVVASFVTGGLL